MAEDFKKSILVRQPAAPDKRAGFAGDVLKLVGGTAIAQAIAIIASPVVARLYGPESFGVSALFTSIAGIVIVIACLRYEMAIMLPKRDYEAANLVGVSITAAAIVSLAVVAAISTAGDDLLRLINAEPLQEYLWLIPPYVFLNGVFLAINYWNLRERRFGRLSVARVVNSVCTASGQVALGIAGNATGGSLILSNIIGFAVATMALGWQIMREDMRQIFGSINITMMIYSIKRYYKFPIFDTWAALLTAIYWQLPPLVLAKFFSPMVVGYYSLGMMVIQLPVSLIGGAVSQVFFQRAAEAKSEGKLGGLVESTANQLVMLGAFPVLILCIAGKDIFIIIFGSRWAEAGVYVQILALWMFFVFLTSPISTLFSVMERQRTSLIINIILLPIRVISLVIGALLGDARISMILFSAVGIISYGGIFFWLIHKSGASVFYLARRIKYLLLRCMPLLIFLAFVAWGPCSDPLLTTVVSVLEIAVYFALLIKFEPEFSISY